jgi:hypothetical protein
METRAANKTTFKQTLIFIERDVVSHNKLNCAQTSCFKQGSCEAPSDSPMLKLKEKT